MIKKSFNEDVIVSFNEYTHSYYYNNTKLQNATTFIGKFYKKFDSENISAASAKAWNVDQKDVQDLWKSNAELAGGFGTAIHKALEHYDKFFTVGKAIQDKKKLPENYAMPKHPVLRSIIEGFIEINKTVGEVIPEILITDVQRGYCGTADRILILDREKKICRVQDYKVNVNSEEVKAELKAAAPFETLPANKITKYQLQLSFYANMLQAAGWVVEGLDVFVYEDGWKFYQLEVLKVI